MEKKSSSVEMTPYEKIGDTVGDTAEEKRAMTEMVYYASEGGDVKALEGAIRRKKNTLLKNLALLALIALSVVSITTRLNGLKNGPQLYNELENELPKFSRLFDGEPALEEVDLNLDEEDKLFFYPLSSGARRRVNVVDWQRAERKRGAKVLSDRYPDNQALYQRMILYHSLKEREELLRNRESRDPDNHFYDLLNLDDSVSYDSRKMSDGSAREFREVFEKISGPIESSDYYWVNYYEKFRRASNEETLLGYLTSIKLCGRMGESLLLGLFMKAVTIISHEEVNIAERVALLDVLQKLSSDVWDKHELLNSGGVYYNYTNLGLLIQAAAEKVEKQQEKLNSEDLRVIAIELRRLSDAYRKHTSDWEDIRSHRSSSSNTHGILSSAADLDKVFPKSARQGFGSLDHTYLMHTSVFAEGYTPDMLDADITPIRNAEHAREVRRAVPFLAAIPLIGIVVLWILRMMAGIPVRRVGDGAATLLTVRDWLWIILLSVIVPLALYFGLALLSPLTGARYALHYLYEGHVVQALTVLVFVITGLVSSVRWRLGIRGQNLNFQKLTLKNWWAYLMAAAGVASVGVYFINETLTKEQLTLLSIPSVIALMWSVWPAQLANHPAQVIYRMASRHVMVKALIFLSLLMTLGLYEWAAHREKVWVQRDTYWRPQVEPYAHNKLDQLTRIELAKRLDLIKADLEASDSQ